MEWKDFLLMTLLIFGMAAVGVAFCVWMTKKAGIPHGTCIGMVGRDELRRIAEGYYLKGVERA